MLSRLFTVTMTSSGDRCKVRGCWCGHGGHGGHGVFAHTYARGCERTRVFCTFYLYACSCVCKNTMTTMTSMTNRVLARVVAVTVGGHGKNKGDQGDFNLLLGFDGE
ncbi:hypothetical protein [Pseudoalteromonas prydzensis]|uniref:hypothetical protein n=1 Tax=Pseudoalteromonas prydzensis TaxID=182141 RepID=UPI0007E509F6|nr:hypothetical protein [Pseudoalteromonas prydzensis]